MRILEAYVHKVLRMSFLNITLDYYCARRIIPNVDSPLTASLRVGVFLVSMQVDKASRL